MQITLALAALAAVAYAQDCKSDFDGTFEISSSSPSKRDLVKRACSGSQLPISLKGGVLTQQNGSVELVGEIANEYQFQFDPQPGQPDNRATSGFGDCGGNLGLNGNTAFYQCSDNTETLIYAPDLSPVGDACSTVTIPIVACSGTATLGGSASVTQGSDGQPGVTSTSSCVPVTQTVDGQLQVSSCPATTSSCVAVTQTIDGQLQVSSCPTSSSCVAVTQTIDGQLQVSSCPTTTSSSSCVAVTQTIDGQLQVSSCPTSTSSCVAVTQTIDGQLQVSSCPSSNGTTVPSASNTFLPASAGNSLIVGSQAAAAILAVIAVTFL